MLLDTHVLLYWLDRASELTEEQREVLARVSPEAPVLVSDISLWEIATLASLGRLRLRMPIRDWLEAATLLTQDRRIIDAGIVETL